MFTGIVEEEGKILQVVSSQGGGKTLTVSASFVRDGGVVVGDSVAHDGICLTATHILEGAYKVDLGPETLARTTAESFSVGTLVNLERAARLDSRLGGHLVQGHVDDVGVIRQIDVRQNAHDLWIDVDTELLPLIIPRGAVTVDGISLTVTGRDAKGFSISVIPHTRQVTTLKFKKEGSSVNIEVDLLARYIAGLLQGYESYGSAGHSKLTYERLKELGY